MYVENVSSKLLSLMVLNFDPMSMSILLPVVILVALDKLFHLFFVADICPMTTRKLVRIQLRIHIPNRDLIRYLLNRPIKYEWVFSLIESETNVVERATQEM